MEVWTEVSFDRRDSTGSSTTSSTTSSIGTSSTTGSSTNTDTASTDTGPKKLPVPSAADQQTALKLIKEIFSTDYAGAKSFDQ